MSYVIYVATDSKSEGSHNTYHLLTCHASVATDSKSEGSHNQRYGNGYRNSLLLMANQRVVTTKVSISQNMSNYNDD